MPADFRHRTSREPADSPASRISTMEAVAARGVVMDHPVPSSIERDEGSLGVPGSLPDAAGRATLSAASGNRAKVTVDQIRTMNRALIVMAALLVPTSLS